MVKKSITMRRIAMGIVVLIIIAVIAHTVLFSYIANNLLSPNRRAIQPYHQKFLIPNNEYGMRIDQHVTAVIDDGNDNESESAIPYVLIYPQKETISKNSQLIRQQLHEKGFSDKQLQADNGIIVLLHGRSGRKEDLLPVAERFSALGFYCVIPDLPAHGDSTLSTVHFASTTFEKNYANHVLKDVRSHLPLQKDMPAYLWGMSLGGVYANAAAQAMPDNWQAMAIVASFDNLHDTLAFRLERYHVPRVLHDGYISLLQTAINVNVHSIHTMQADNTATDTTALSTENHTDRLAGIPINQINPQQWATSITTPTLVTHGKQDTIIAIEQAQNLYQSYPQADRKWLTVDSAGHNNVLTTSAPVYATIATWFLEHPQHTKKNHDAW